MSTMNLPPLIIQQFMDNNGVPLSGGSLYTYQAGTTTPQATYTDQSGVTPNANPIVLDSAGRCAMWLDPTLSYKFLLQDSGGNTIKTIDNVIGLLGNNAVPTAALQDGSVTSSKLASGAVNAAAMASDSSIDANRPVNTNSIRDGAITYPKFNTSQGLMAPTFQSFTSGSGTYNKTYLFLVSSANATSGATYTNNGITYTVTKTAASGSIIQATGSAAPQSSGTLTKATGTGDATIAFTSYAAPLFLKVKMVGGGGGGGGSGTSSGTGGTGGNTTFGTSLLTANGGVGGGNGGSAGGAGGTATIGSGAVGLAISGGQGMGSGSSSTNVAPGIGANSPFGGSGSVLHNSAGQAAVTNSGSGGGGACDGAGGSAGGGGAGGFIEAIISSPSATYAYAVGSAGTAGAAGSGSAGGAGGSGVILVEEHYQ